MTGDEAIAALDLPAAARLDRRVPKTLLLEHGAPTAADKRHISEGIEQILWVAALKPTTIGVAAHRDDAREYLEIAVLRIVLRAAAKIGSAGRARASRGAVSRLRGNRDRVPREPLARAQALVAGRGRQDRARRRAGGRRLPARRGTARTRARALPWRSGNSRKSRCCALYQGWIDVLLALRGRPADGPFEIPGRRRTPDRSARGAAGLRASRGRDGAPARRSGEGEANAAAGRAEPGTQARRGRPRGRARTIVRNGMTMKKLTADDPESRSPDLIAENVERLKAFFPELVTEGPNGAAVNVDVLKTLVGDATVTDADEKYGLNWHGKRRARQLALTPSAGTLRPCPEDSVDWDTTQNLMIEGDNLEVLKLLQKSYAGKVKLIYIDPPYNTGKDFVYPDNFQDSIKNYLELTGQVEGGAKISSNTEASGRFHTDWLNMMYPRLGVARNFFRSDGAIFVSIADQEVQNLRAVLDDVFGGENFIATVIWHKMDSPKNSAVHFSEDHDYLLVYAREAEAWRPNGLERTEGMIARYKNPDDDPRGPWLLSELGRPKLLWAGPLCDYHQDGASDILDRPPVVIGV